MAWTDVARRQAGLITRRQLMTFISAATVDSLVRRGWLERTPTDAVYRVAGAPNTPEYAAWHAALSTRSPLSFLSAGHWWDMPMPDDRLVHITRMGRRRLDWPPGVRVHRVAIDRSKIVQERGLWVTTRPETVLDCAGWLAVSAGAPLLDRALQQGWLTVADIDRRLHAEPGRWGNRRLRWLADRVGDRAAAESERVLHRLLRRARISGWQPNLTVIASGRTVEIDVALPAVKLAIEIDGFRYHDEDDRFQGDRTKQNALIGAGWRVLRFTWTDLHVRPQYVVVTICELLAARPQIA